ncbi:Protein ALP1-like [Lucilia cuprina]|nr:Protein ALP1-like [Lucilia cuprina]
MYILCYRNISVVTFWGVCNDENVPVPPHKPLSASTDDPFSHYFIGDAAFPLRNNLMRPYPGSNLDTKKAIYNYRLSRARQVIKNSFGIVYVRWRIPLTTIEMAPENVDVVVLACTALHNFIMLNDQKRWYCPEGYVDREAKDGTVQEGVWKKNEIYILKKTLTSSQKKTETIY